MLRCWNQDPTERPSFKEVLDILVELSTEDKKVSESVQSQGSEIYKFASEDYDVHPVDYGASKIEYQQHLENQNYNQVSV